MIAGGSWRSASIGIMASPFAIDIPALSAASLPKLRDKLAIIRWQSPPHFVYCIAFVD